MGWNDLENKSTGKEIPYLKLPVGSTVLRVLDEEPKSRWTHWIPQANKGKGVGVDCPGKDCPICELKAEDKKNKVQSKYSTSKSHSINVFVKKQGAEVINKVMVLDKGNKVFSGLKAIMDTMVAMELTPDLRTVDVSIIRTGEDLGSINYSCIPLFPVSEMTEEMKSVEKFNLAEIKPMLDREQILKLMEGASFDEVLNKEETETTENNVANVDFTEAI